MPTFQYPRSHLAQFPEICQNAVVSTVLPQLFECLGADKRVAV